MYRREAYVHLIYHGTPVAKGGRRRSWLRALAVAVTTILVTAALLLLAKPLPVEVSAAPKHGAGLSATAVDAGSLYRSGAEELLSAEPALPERSVPLILLDPGHGGEDEGCASGGILEKDVNLAIALLVRDRLNALGYEVVMTRDTDTYIAKEDRVILANSLQADLYVSIHQNSSEDPGVSGFEVWYQEDSSRDNRRLALLLQQQTLQYTGAAARELHGDAEFHVTGKTTMPACLIETGFLTNDAERMSLTAPEYQAQLADGITQAVDLYFHPKTMYLTFDDGPSPENTIRVLDTLQEQNIKATFFLVGENVRRYPEVVQRIVADGHTIGIHCDNHDYRQLYASVDSYLADFETAHQTLLDLTGIDVKLFRFPGGSINDFNAGVRDEIIQEMTARGYIYYDWNASLEDAVTSADPAQLIANGVSTTLGRQKVIMLAHDVKTDTAGCLSGLLDALPEYEMLPLTEEVAPIQF